MTRFLSLLCSVLPVLQALAVERFQRVLHRDPESLVDMLSCLAIEICFVLRAAGQNARKRSYDLSKRSSLF